MIGALATLCALLGIGPVTSSRVESSPPGPDLPPAASWSAPASPGELTVTAPNSLAPGQLWPIAVTGAAADVPIQVTVAFGAVRRLTFTDTTDANGDVRLQVSSDQSQWAGLVQITAITRGAIGRATTRLVPGAVVGPLTPSAGPRSIVADRIDKSEWVLLARDRYGNAPLDGTRFDLWREHPNGEITTAPAVSKNLVAHDYLPSKTLAGIDRMHVRHGSLSSGVLDFRETAGPPVPFELVPPASLPDADGHSLAYLETSILRDAFGNIQPDGTEVSLTAVGPDNYWSLVGQVVGGKAQFAITAPDSPTTFRFTGICRGRSTSKPLELTFGAAGVTLPIRSERRREQVTLEVGPILDRNGAIVPEGTTVEGTVSGHPELTHRALTVDGMARLELVVPETMRTGAVIVTALGERKEVPLP